MTILFKVIKPKHYDRAMAREGENRQRYIISLVEQWNYRVGDYEQLSPEQIEEVVSEFRAVFEVEKAEPELSRKKKTK